MNRLSTAKLSQVLPPRRTVARIALVEIEGAAQQVLSDCFRQFGLEVVLVARNAAQRMQLEKFEACVVRLRPEFQPVMESARTSPSNNRMVLYGLGGSAQEALQFSKFGINAIFREPLDRFAALKLVRATQTMVLHEFHRYVRVPVIAEVSLKTKDGQQFTATSREFSSGGMSMSGAEQLQVGAEVDVSFSLLTLSHVLVHGRVSWRKAQEFGIHFDAQDEQRLRIKRWINGHVKN